jgi:hypothetical protein
MPTPYRTALRARQFLRERATWAAVRTSEASEARREVVFNCLNACCDDRRSRPCGKQPWRRTNATWAGPPVGRSRLMFRSDPIDPARDWEGREPVGVGRGGARPGTLALAVRLIMGMGSL